ncbi:MAG: helix-turn-helix transcriptional regulator [Anaerolineae bacterium]|nr:helix-turn-helix transcriptional regulator [Anaerolineae bacterium]
MGNLIEFSEWLGKEIKSRGWSAANLSRRSGVASAQISRILNRERGIGPDSCLAIARALGVPPVEVFRRAGLLPGNFEVGALSDFTTRVRGVAESMTPAEREELLELVYLFYRQAKERRQRSSSNHSAAACST